MKVSKEQIVKGFIKFAKEEVIRKVTDRPMQMIMTVVVSALEVNPASADKYLNKLLEFVSSEDGLYDLDALYSIVEKTMNQYGDFPLEIPPIPMVSPRIVTLTFNSTDVNKLKSYILEDANGRRTEEAADRPLT